MLRALSSCLPRSFKWYLARLRQNARARRRHFSPYNVQKNLGGISFEFWIGDPVGEEWYVPLNTLLPEHEFLRDHMLEANDVVLECGAHHGFTTILIANWVGQRGQVIALEASPGSAKILQDNITRNHLGNVIVKNQAASEQTGEIEIFDGSNSAVVPGHQRWGTIRVPAVCLDEYAAYKPTFVKLDVEGFEIQVLKGASQILATRPKFEIEVHTDMIRNYGSNADELLYFFDPAHYHLWLQTNAESAPQPYNGESLSAMHQRQIHLFAIPRERDA